MEYLKRCVDVLSQIASPVERSVYVSKIAKEQGISRDALDLQINSVIKKRVNAEKKQDWNEIRTFSEKRKADPAAVDHPREYKAEQGIIAYLCVHPEELSFVEQSLSADSFLTDFHKKVYEKLISGMNRSADFNILSLQSEFPADEMGKITAILSEAQELEISRKAAEDYINILNGHKSDEQSASPPSALSDDDFLSLAKKIRSRK